MHIGHLVQLGVADFSEKWALLFTEAPKELPDRNISLVVIDMATMAIRHIIKVRAWELHLRQHDSDHHCRLMSPG